MSVIGKIHSFQSLGTVDGPGIRFVVFMQGCNLRCSCCHNPDTWDMTNGREYNAEEVVSRVERYKEYFGADGGITVSGGEPLLQSEFVYELFMLCMQKGIHTCLDTSGGILNEKVKAVLHYTDYVLLDVKYVDNDRYLKYVGCSIEKPLEFLKYIDSVSIPTTIRQVIIPEINDSLDDMLKLKALIGGYKCVKKIELLPFKKLCVTKYETLGIDFPFISMREPTIDEMNHLNEKLKEGE